MADQAVEFWALGGQPRPQTLSAGKGLLHYTGSPQGRTPDDPGPHGCTLVNVNGDRTVHTEFVPTDALRWHTEHVSIEEGATLKSVRDQLSERARKLIAEAESRPLIVSWMVCGGQHLAGPAARRDLAAEWQAWLRQEFFIRDSKPALWTHALELEQPQLPEPWFEEESMLGDFLRRLREFAASPTDAASLAEAIPPHHRTDALSALAQWLPEEHRAVFDEAALTGAQLLGAGERET